jgi:hypothetical protein
MVFVWLLPNDVQLTELKEKLEAADETLKKADYRARSKVTHVKSEADLTTLATKPAGAP